MVIKLFLLPFSCIFALTGFVRNLIYQKFSAIRYKSPLSVICLGNISVGGSGKTPIGLSLSKHLTQNKKVGVLLRGYKSKSREARPLEVNESHTAKDVGDEALLYKSLLGNSGHVVISPNRKNGLQLLENLGSEIIVMDDGLQHFKVKPSMPICVIEVADLPKINHPQILDILPSGRLREWPSLSLRRSSHVIFSKKSTLTDSDKILINNCIKIYALKSYSCLEIIADEIFDGTTGSIIENKGNLKGIFLSSVARPKLVEEDLKRLGVEIEDRFIYPDHKLISEDNWKAIKAKNSPVFCTEKDLIKIKSFLKEPNEVYVLRQRICEQAPSTSNLFQLVDSLLQ